MDRQSLSDEELMKLLQQTATSQDTFAPESLPYLEELYNRYYQQVIRILRYYGLSRDEAEDVAQEVFIRLYYRCHSYNPERPFKYWFFRIVYHLSITYKTTKNKQSFHSYTTDDSREEIVDEEKNFSERFQFWHTFESILDKMPEKTRVVLVWHLVEDLSFEEIASLLNITSRQVRNRYSQALEWVRKQLGRGANGEI